ncbi:MAG: hypothetical protein J5985_06260 [Kiritimatiellae bacterium]|nr:hypothetical protein [Kiritimatiellia bacterium]
MTNERGKSGIFWGLLDGFLIVAIFLLIGYSAIKGSGVLSTRSEQKSEHRKTEQVAPEKQEESVPAKRSSRVVKGIRVSNGFSAGQAMESMATDDWSGVRTAPAMDMRENGKSFEVVFTLSGEMDAQSIRTVIEKGNELKLTMQSKSGKKLTKKVQIPWYENLEGANLQSLVTNRVLRVKITP